MMDGGTMFNLNIVGAVQRCREIVDQDSKITIDISVCGSPTLGNWTDRGDAIGTFMRRNSIKSFQESMEDIYAFKQSFPEVNFRYFVHPSEPLKNGIGMIDFNNSTNTWHSQMVGRKDGAIAVQLGPDWMSTKMDLWRDMLPELKTEFKVLREFIKQEYTKDVETLGKMEKTDFTQDAPKFLID
jgi:hypothetical protein